MRLAIYQGRKRRGSYDGDQKDERGGEEYNLKDGKDHRGRNGGYVLGGGVDYQADYRDDFCVGEEQCGGWEKVLQTLMIC